MCLISDSVITSSVSPLDEEMQFQHARPVTLKRAAIKTQLQNTVSVAPQQE